MAAKSRGGPRIDLKVLLGLGLGGWLGFGLGLGIGFALVEVWA